VARNAALFAVFLRFIFSLGQLSGTEGALESSQGWSMSAASANRSGAERKELWKSDRNWTIRLRSFAELPISATPSGLQDRSTVFQWFRTSLRYVLHHWLPSRAPSVQL